MRYPRFYQQQIAIAVRAFNTKNADLLGQQLEFCRRWGAELEIATPLLEAMLASLGVKPKTKR